MDSSVYFIYHDPSDLGSLILIRIIPKERTLSLAIGRIHPIVKDREGSGRGLQKNCQRAFPLVLGGLWWVDQKKKKRTTWETILLCVWSILVKFSIYYGPERHANFNNATEHEDPAALAIFLGIFLGTGRVFRWVLQRTTRLNAQTVELPRVRCCRGKMVDLQAWKVTRSKNFTKKHMEIAPFYIDRSKVLAILS